MSSHTLNLKLKLTRMGWCLFVNGLAYAVGTQAYCIKVANTVRRDYALHGLAAIKGGAA